MAPPISALNQRRRANVANMMGRRVPEQEFQDDLPLEKKGGKRRFQRPRPKSALNPGEGDTGGGGGGQDPRGGGGQDPTPGRGGSGIQNNPQAPRNNGALAGQGGWSNGPDGPVWTNPSDYNGNPIMGFNDGWYQAGTYSTGDPNYDDGTGTGYAQYENAPPADRGGGELAKKGNNQIPKPKPPKKPIKPGTGPFDPFAVPKQPRPGAKPPPTPPGPKYNDDTYDDYLGTYQGPGYGYNPTDAEQPPPPPPQMEGPSEMDNPYGGGPPPPPVFDPYQEPDWANMSPEQIAAWRQQASVYRREQANAYNKARLMVDYNRRNHGAGPTDEELKADPELAAYYKRWQEFAIASMASGQGMPEFYKPYVPRPAPPTGTVVPNPDMGGGGTPPVVDQNPPVVDQTPPTTGPPSDNQPPGGGGAWMRQATNRSRPVNVPRPSGGTNINSAHEKTSVAAATPPGTSLAPPLPTTQGGVAGPQLNPFEKRRQQAAQRRARLAPRSASPTQQQPTGGTGSVRAAATFNPFQV